MGKLADKLTAQQRSDFENVFSKFDRDGSGAIDRAEMNHLLGSFGFQHVTQEDLDAILAKIDEDLSGSVSKDEFMEFMATQTEMLDKECSMSIFDIIDNDNDGEIDYSEFVHVVRALNPQAKEVDMKKTFKLADRDGQGTVDREEFKDVLKNNDCSIWRELGLSLATVAVIREVVEQYSRLAKTPSAGFGTLKPLPYGKDNAKNMGYDVDSLPDVVWESACQCANVFDLVQDKNEFLGAKIVEFGCGAGADLCVAASLVGPKGSVIGIDMNRPMVKKANQNIETCKFTSIATAHVAIFDGPALPDVIKAGSADYVIVNGTVNLSPRKLCAFRNAQRALKKRGRLLMADVVLKESGSDIPVGKGSWCDCVAGAVTIDKMKETVTKAGFSEIQHVGYSQYLTSENTPTGTFIAYNGKSKSGSSTCSIL